MKVARNYYYFGPTIEPVYASENSHEIAANAVQLFHGDCYPASEYRRLKNECRNVDCIECAGITILDDQDCTCDARRTIGSISSNPESFKRNVMNALQCLEKQHPKEYATILEKFPEPIIWDKYGLNIDTNAMEVPQEWSLWLCNAIDDTRLFPKDTNASN